MPQAPVFEVENLNVEIGGDLRPISPVRDVSLSLVRGEALGIVGESGSGKSMTALALMGLLPQAARRRADRIVLDGLDLTTMPDRAFARTIAGKRMAMIFQDPMTSLNPVYTIGRQLTETMMLHSDVGYRQARERAVHLLDRVGFREPRLRLNQYPHQLSGGLRQRAMIAMALMNEPDLIIADEPTTALDVTTQKVILELLAELQRELGMAMILITHNLGVVSHTVDKVAVMYAGEIVEHGEVSRVLNAPLHPYTQGLLRCLPDAEVDKGQTRLGSIPGMVPPLLGRMQHCGFADRCPRVQDACRTARPSLRPADSGALVRCILGDAVLREPAREQVTRLVRPAAAAPASAAPEAIFRAEHLACEFKLRKGLFAKPEPIRAVDDVSFELGRGEVLGIVGESGSGKSTLAKILLGLQQPTGGTIRFRGTPLAETDLRERTRSVQAVFQDPYSSLNPRRTVGEAIRRPLDIHRVGDAAERRELVENTMELVGLSRRLFNAYPGQMSGGQRQRVAIARAVVMNPAVLICDEPTSALDVSVQAQILNLLLDLKDRLDLTYVLITHDLGVVRYFATRIGVMYGGRLVEMGAKADVLGRPAHEHTRTLLASALTIRPLTPPPAGRNGTTFQPGA